MAKSGAGQYNAQQDTRKYPYFPPFKEFFSMEALRRWGRVIDASDFVAQFGPQWKEAGVVGFSYSGDGKKFMDNVPRQPFWDEFGVKFDRFGRTPRVLHSRSQPFLPVFPGSPPAMITRVSVSCTVCYQLPGAAAAGGRGRSCRPPGARHRVRAGPLSGATILHARTPLPPLRAHAQTLGFRI